MYILWSMFNNFIVDIVFNILVSYDCMCAKHLTPISDDRALYKYFYYYYYYNNGSMLSGLMRVGVTIAKQINLIWLKHYNFILMCMF